MGTRTRTEITSEEKRRDHQKDLAKEMNDKAYKRIMEGKTNDRNLQHTHSNIAYKNPEQIPTSEVSIKEFKLYIDKR